MLATFSTPGIAFFSKKKKSENLQKIVRRQVSGCKSGRQVQRVQRIQRAEGSFPGMTVSQGRVGIKFVFGVKYAKILHQNTGSKKSNHRGGASWTCPQEMVQKWKLFGQCCPHCHSTRAPFRFATGPETQLCFPLTLVRLRPGSLTRTLIPFLKVNHNTNLIHKNNRIHWKNTNKTWRCI